MFNYWTIKEEEKRKASFSFSWSFLYLRKLSWGSGREGKDKHPPLSLSLSLRVNKGGCVDWSYDKALGRRTEGLIRLQDGKWVEFQ